MITVKTFIPVLLISLTLLFCLTAVSAADNDTIYVATNGSDANDGFSWNTPKLTIKNATWTLNANGTIYIANGEYKGENNTRIVIDKNMTIVGESQTGTIINGTGTHWIFNIAHDNLNVKLLNLMLTNGSEIQGENLNGAILNYANLTVENCTFTDNTASAGGAICNTWDGVCNVKGCTFTGNNANVHGGAIFHGGNGIFTVTNSNFINNTAQYGGAICDGNRDLIVENCTFTNNTADDGGVIMAWAGSNLDIFGCSFIGNMANKNGGAINFNCPVNITYCTFINNTANGNGGSIYSWTYKIMKINFNRFYNNTALNGNAIYADYSSLDIENNWWGSNNPVWGSLISGLDHPDNWVILSVNATPNSIKNGETSTITADLNHINGGGDLTGGRIPDGPITLNIPWGSFTSSGITHSITLNTIDGIVTATFYANERAVNPLFNPVKVTATADGYTTNNAESAYITIDKISDLYIKITSNKKNPQVGKTFTITYKLGNNGPDEAKNVTITIPLPEGFKYTNISGDGVWTYNTNNNTITWTLTNVPVGDPYLYISGHVNKPGAYVFSSSISSETYNINTEGVTPVTINAVNEVNAASKTIPLQETGLPISGLILAILAVFGGLAASKRK